MKIVCYLDKVFFWEMADLIKFNHHFLKIKLSG